MDDSSCSTTTTRLSGSPDDAPADSIIATDEPEFDTACAI
jgi:hypothetical protein